MKWYQRDPGRYAIEKRLLAKFHRGAKIKIEGGKMSVFKKVVGRKDTYLVETIFSSQHPYSPMQVHVRQPCLKRSSPHKFFGSHICIHGTNDVGPETTAKVYLDWAVQWIKTYENWLDGKPWPETNRA